MREIKFRGKRIDNDEWVVGFAFSRYENCDYRWFINFDFEKFEVIPETIGQYTGLQDKNGAEIYEGDEVWGRAGEHRSGVWEYEKLFIVEYGWSQSMRELSMCDEIEISPKFSQRWNLPAGAEHNM